MTRRPKMISSLIALIIMLSFSAVYADEGDGAGTSSGDNKEVALTLESSSITDGGTDVPINPTIQLTFNKNICNITVLPNNKMCFHLSDENGKAVPIDLIFPDDQVQHDYRHEVFIMPRKNLEPNSSYRVSVDNTLSAKNGTIIDNAHTITFTTGADTTADKNETLKALGDYTVAYETSLSETENSVPVNKDLINGDSEGGGISTDTIVKIAAAVIILIIIVFTCVIIIRRRSKRTS